MQEADNEELPDVVVAEAADTDTEVEAALVPEVEGVSHREPEALAKSASEVMGEIQLDENTLEAIAQAEGAGEQVLAVALRERQRAQDPWYEKLPKAFKEFFEQHPRFEKILKGTARLAWNVGVPFVIGCQLKEALGIQVNPQQFLPLAYVVGSSARRAVSIGWRYAGHLPLIKLGLKREDQATLYRSTVLNFERYGRGTKIASAILSFSPFRKRAVEHFLKVDQRSQEIKGALSAAGVLDLETGMLAGELGNLITNIQTLPNKDELFGKLLIHGRLAEFIDPVAVKKAEQEKADRQKNTIKPLQEHLKQLQHDKAPREEIERKKQEILAEQKKPLYDRRLQEALGEVYLVLVAEQLGSGQAERLAVLDSTLQDTYREAYKKIFKAEAADAAVGAFRSVAYGGLGYLTRSIIEKAREALLAKEYVTGPVALKGESIAPVYHPPLPKDQEIIIREVADPEVPGERIIDRSHEILERNPLGGQLKLAVKAANEKLVEVGRAYDLADYDEGAVFTPTEDHPIIEIIKEALREQGVDVELTESDFALICSYVAEGNYEQVIEAVKAAHSVGNHEFLGIAADLGFTLDLDAPERVAFSINDFENQILLVRMGNKEAIMKFLKLINGTKKILLPSNIRDLIPSRTVLSQEEAKRIIQQEIPAYLRALRDRQNELMTPMVEVGPVTFARELEFKGVTVPTKAVVRTAATAAAAAAGTAGLVGGLGAGYLWGKRRGRREAAAAPPEVTPEPATPEPVTPAPLPPDAIPAVEVEEEEEPLTAEEQQRVDEFEQFVQYFRWQDRLGRFEIFADDAVRDDESRQAVRQFIRILEELNLPERMADLDARQLFGYPSPANHPDDLQALCRYSFTRMGPTLGTLTSRPELLDELYPDEPERAQRARELLAAYHRRAQEIFLGFEPAVPGEPLPTPELAEGVTAEVRLRRHLRDMQVFRLTLFRHFEGFAEDGREVNNISAVGTLINNLLNLSIVEGEETDFFTSLEDHQVFGREEAPADRNALLGFKVMYLRPLGELLRDDEVIRALFPEKSARVRVLLEALYDRINTIA